MQLRNSYTNYTGRSSAQEGRSREPPARESPACVAGIPAHIGSRSHFGQNRFVRKFETLVTIGVRSDPGETF